MHDRKMTTVSVPIPPEVLWPLVTLLGLFCLVWLAYKDRASIEKPWLDQLRSSLGLNGLDGGIFALALAVYFILFASLSGGLLWLIWDVILRPFNNVGIELGELRQRVIAVAGLTATLGALVALPLTFFRLTLSQRQTYVSEQGLITDRIQKANEQLGNESPAVRMGAILQLERILSDSAIDRSMVLEMLNAYVKFRDAESSSKVTEIDTEAAMRILLDNR